MAASVRQNLHLPGLEGVLHGASAPKGCSNAQLQLSRCLVQLNTSHKGLVLKN